MSDNQTNASATGITEVLALSKKQAKGSHNNAFYQKQRQEFIKTQSEHADPIVRLSVVTNPNCPTGTLKDRLLAERDQKVLTALILNKEMPVEALRVFCETRLTNDPACKFIAEESGKQVLAHMKARFNPASLSN